MAIHFTGLLVWQYILRDFSFGNTFHGTSCLAIHLTGFVCLASLQARLRGCQTNLAKCIAIQHQRTELIHLCSLHDSFPGLAVSFLPYAPSFVNWHSAWDYLTPHGLKRGARLFLREQTGAVSVGADQQLYASNKFFA
ncbi:hypothetical protein Y032_0007g3300 [Ancylostoma ceylanicum]|uniref:Uncharacterized protein n=1 Tax=Ancylostoma ceylanicum TaxID=53326 RepID=A0A016VMG9_9BILA|nr:hypothetical protein Y032_0007g3300 [Ancylostoma ceylanicum]